MMESSWMLLLQSYLVGNYERGSWMLIPLDWLHKSQKKRTALQLPRIYIMPFGAPRDSRGAFLFTERARDASVEHERMINRLQLLRQCRPRLAFV